MWGFIIQSGCTFFFFYSLTKLGMAQKSWQNLSDLSEKSPPHLTFNIFNLKLDDLRDFISLPTAKEKRRKKGRSSPPCPLGSTHTHSPNTHASNLPTLPVWRSPTAPLAARSWAEIRSSWLFREAKNPLFSPLLRSVSDGPTGREKRGRSKMEWRGFTAKKLKKNKREPSQVVETQIF